MRPRKAFELVKKANPVDATQLTDSATQPPTLELFERIVRQPYKVSLGHRDRPPRRKVLLMHAGMIGVVVVLVAEAWLFFQGGEQVPPVSSVIAGSTATIAPTSTSQVGGIIPPGDHGMILRGNDYLGNQVATAEVIVWGEVVAVEPPGRSEQGDQTTAESLVEGDLLPVYSMYLVAPHEIWKGDVATDTPLALLVEGGGMADGAVAGANRAALPTLHIGDQVVVLAARKSEYGPATANDYWILHGAKSVFKAEGDSVFSRLEPVPDDPSGNMGSLLWLRGLLEDD